MAIVGEEFTQGHSAFSKDSAKVLIFVGVTDQVKEWLQTITIRMLLTLENYLNE